MEGWIKLHRKFLDWEWFCVDEMVKLFIYLLLTANYEKKTWRGIKIERGQLLTGLNSLHEKTKISHQTLRTCLNRLEKTGEINKQSTNKYTLITICNYECYQDYEITTNNQPNEQLTNDQQTTNKQLTTTKEIKKDNNENKEKNIRAHLFKNSEFYDFEKFKNEFLGSEWELVDLKYYYDSAIDYSDSKGKKYSNWIAAVRSWMRKDKKDNKLKVSGSYITRTNHLA
jgi:hypothetical protein